jgi:hypothetical protein
MGTPLVCVQDVYPCTVSEYDSYACCVSSSLGIAVPVTTVILAPGKSPAKMVLSADKCGAARDTAKTVVVSAIQTGGIAMPFF